LKIFIGVFLFTINAFAFTLNNNANLAFTKNPVKINIASGFCTNIGINETELLSIAKDAVDEYWNKAPTSGLKMRSGAVTSVSTNFKTGLICNSGTNCDPNSALAVSSDILISCNQNSSNFSSNSVLAVTVPNNISGSTINGALIILNDTATSNQLALKSRDEIVAIVAHEIGHAIGLGHSPVRDSLMYYQTVPNRRSLGEDDLSGLSYLYPKTQPVSCGTIADINSNQSPTNIVLGFFLGIIGVFLAKSILRI
jgi:hypothetical protein